ncbi:hypothetical protein BDZ97DRAFT_1918148 [Flammula alnicola]|nr:hypothetical protein BDZ97DRAFT_1918148 [Flammula alnicola]
MLHFPSKLQTNGPNGIPRRSDSIGLNATQQRSSSHPIFLKIEEELHDARRVHSDGQEDDLRYALSMVINRVSELSSLLSEAYKTQADLEVQLNVAKSNLQLVIANNEMLEDALRRDSGQSKDVGWRRSSGRDGDAKNPRASVERSQSVDYPPVPSDPSPPPSASPPTSSASNTPHDNRFFKFRFSSAAPTTSRPPSRPESAGGSPQPAHANASSVQAYHLTSPSMPSLSSAVRSKELDDLTAELEKERAARKKVADQKKALEEELESLSQALFEEANKMVATERKMRAETEEELKELKLEKEAMRSALQLIEGENTHLRENSLMASPQPDAAIPGAELLRFSRSHSRSSSQTAIKSRPASLVLDLFPPLPPSPSPDGSAYDDEVPHETTTTTAEPRSTQSLTPLSPEEDSQPTPRFRLSTSPLVEPSPWADVPSSSRSVSPAPAPTSSSSVFAKVAYAGVR